jgi:hypothetical protein
VRDRVAIVAGMPRLPFASVEPALEFGLTAGHYLGAGNTLSLRAGASPVGVPSGHDPVSTAHALIAPRTIGRRKSYVAVRRQAP